MSIVIKTQGLSKNYDLGEVQVNALKGIDLEVHKGEYITILGASGSGKSTLLNLLGCLDQASSGKYFLDNMLVGSLHENEYAVIRNEKIGFIFQGFNLLKRTSAYHNVELPLIYDKNQKNKDRHKIIIDALNMVGLGERIHHMPQQLSGGQQQRVAIARALVNNPSIILADEPTGNLDSKTSREILSILQKLNDEGITIILVTHELALAEYTKRIIELSDGSIIRDEIIKNRKIFTNSN